jgi:hypothetical protein
MSAIEGFSFDKGEETTRQCFCRFYFISDIQTKFMLQAKMSMFMHLLAVPDISVNSST